MLKRTPYSPCASSAAATASRSARQAGGSASLVPDSPDWYAQMITLPLLGHDTERLTRRLREAYQIEIPFTKWNDQMGIRASFQGYNTQADADLLLKGLEVVLAEVIQ